MNSISIIIPTLNEAKNISKLIWHLNTQSTTTIIKEIIVVDGGSNDGTKDIITNAMLGKSKSSTGEEHSPSLEFTPIKLFTSAKGRAKQMNHGARNATGSILYFLHADSFPPNGYDRLIFHHVQGGNKAGCFKMKFDSNHWWLQLAGWFTKFNWKACRGGDQSLFVTKDLFDEIAGYHDTYAIYEDIDLINQLYDKTTFTVIQEHLITSARRYQKNSVWKLQYHFWMIYFKKWMGASSQELEAYYLKYVQ